MASVFLAVSEASADRITLRAEAEVEGAPVTLADVARLEGDRAAALGDLQVARFKEGAGESMTLARRDVRAVLDDRGVNWGFLSLRGRLSVQVHRREAARRNADAEAKTDTRDRDTESAEPARAAVASGEPAEANPVPETISVDAVSTPPVEAPQQADAPTLQALVRDWIAARTGIDGEALRIGWDDADAELRALRAIDGRLELDPHTRDPLGRLPLTVRHYEGDRLVDAHRFTLDVAASLPVLTATRALSRGQAITAEDVARQTVRIDSTRTTPLSDLDRVLGRVAARSVRGGSILEPDDVSDPDLVRRGELLTVRALSGGLVLKTVARAMEAGQRDQIIRARHPKTREIIHVRVSGPQAAVMLVGEGEGQGETKTRSNTSSGGDS